MKILHTSDWHVGKTIRGHSRLDEHREVLAEIVAAAADNGVDLVVVAGDLYETAAPSAESELVVNQTLLDLADIAPVVAVSGNHDNARRFEAVAPLLKLGRITVGTRPRRPDDGGVVSIDTTAGTAKVALLPFVSQRSIVKAVDLMAGAGFQNVQNYGERLKQIVDALSASFSADAVNVIVAHAYVLGAETGGGERPAHLVDEYAMAAIDFPPTATYVALGHLHRAQKVPGATALHYCGSPLQLDFGEQLQAKQVNLVEAEPGLPAKVTAVPLTGGRRLLTLTGTLAELATVAARRGEELADAWLRVRIAEPARVGLADEVRSLFGSAVVDVRVEHEADPRRAAGGGRDRSERSPNQLFADYLAEAKVADRSLEAAFGQLYERVEQGQHL